MKLKKKLLLGGIISFCALLLIVIGTAIYISLADFGYARAVTAGEKAARDQIVSTAISWLGAKESDGSHQPVIDLYNSHEPLAMDYQVTYSDEWCATFVSAVAIQCGMTDIIPTECGCQRQIGLFQNLGCWQEDDSYLPLPGDCIFYCQSDRGFGDCTGWSDHVGIVVGTLGPVIKVIEGNYGGQVQYHYILRNSPGIRGYAVPNYPN